jgi:peptide/nickel transport system substrate-binding protein
MFINISEIVDSMAHESQERSGGRTAWESRRRFLQALGAGTVVGVAGCAGDGDDGGDGSGDGDGGAAIDDSLTFAGGGPKVQFNPFNASNYHDGQVLYDPFARYNPVDDKFHAILADDWSVEGTSASLTIPEGRTWSDGSEITADDVATRFKIGKHMGETVWDFTESVSKAGDYSVEFTLDGEPNKFLFLFNMLETRMSTPKEIYGDYLQAIEEAGSEDEKNNAISELTKFNLEDPLASGPFKWDRKEGQQFYYKRRESGAYPNIEEINWTTFDFKGGGSGTEENEALASGKVDGTMGIFIPPKVADSLPDGMRLIPRNMFTGMAVYISWDHEVWGGVDGWRARKALALAANIKQTAEASNLHGGDEYPQVRPLDHWIDGDSYPNTGLDPTTMWEYIEPVKDKYEHYLTNSKDTDKAAELMKAAGFSKQDGTWVKENGEPLKVVYKDAAQAQDRVPMGESFLSQWKDFGIEGEHVVEEGSTFWGKSIPEGDFMMATENWNPTSVPHPYFTFFTEFNDPARQQSMNYPDWSQGIEVPWPVGNVGGWDETKTVKPNEMVSKLGEAQPGSEEETRLVRELAWIWNQTALCLMNCTGHWPWVLSDDEWDIPDKDHKAWKMPNHPLPFITRPQLEEFPAIKAKTQ